MHVRNFKLILRNQYGSELSTISLDAKPSTLQNNNKVKSETYKLNGQEFIKIGIKQYYDENRKRVLVDHQKEVEQKYLNKVEEFNKIKRCTLNNVLRSNIASEYPTLKPKFPS
jgi:hypothetical protein